MTRSRLPRGRHRRAGGRAARYAVGGLALVAGAFEVAYLIAGATVSGGGVGAGGLGAAEAPSRPPDGASRGAGQPGDTGGPGGGGATPDIRPSATSLLLAGTTPLPGATVTPASPPGPTATPAPGRPGSTGPRATPRPPSGPGGAAHGPTGAPTAAPATPPATGRPVQPPDSPPFPDGPGLCVPVVGLCVSPLGDDDGQG